MLEKARDITIRKANVARMGMRIERLNGVQMPREHAVARNHASWLQLVGTNLERHSAFDPAKTCQHRNTPFFKEVVANEVHRRVEG
jgi:hypothetical protein